MGDLYRETGLPKPIWPYAAPGPGRSWKILAWLPPLLLLLLGFGAYRVWRTTLASLFPSAPSVEATPVPAEERHIQKRPKIQMETTLPIPKPVRAEAPVLQAPFPKVSPPPQPATAPPQAYLPPLLPFPPNPP